MTNNPPTEPTPDAPLGATDVPQAPVAPEAPEAPVAAEAPAAAEAQPTEVYPPAVGGYGEAYAPPAPTTPDYAAQAPYVVPTAPVYGQPGMPQAYAPAPAAPDTRSKKVAWVALGLSIAGLLLSLLGFIPVVWVGLALAVLGGVVLLVAFIFSIIGLAGRRNGGKPISIVALVVSILGGFVAVFALIVSLVFLGLSTASQVDSLTPDPVPAPTSSVDDGTTGDGDSDTATTADEDAFLAAVRPKVTDIMMAIDPTMTAEQVEAAFSDENLIAIGQALLATGEEGIDPFVEQTLSGTGDVMSAEQLHALFQAIYDEAKAHLE